MTAVDVALDLAADGQISRPPMSGPDPPRAVTPETPWLPASPVICSAPGERNPTSYEAILAQFDVEHNPRYVPRDGKTYCNIFAWDVTRAMGAELPHWVDPLGRPTTCDDPSGQRMNCNAISEWLHSVGHSYGWTQTDEEGAVRAAALGHPTVAIWRNPSGNGHVAMVRPDGMGLSGPFCAQAGKVCFQQGEVARAFGGFVPEWWSHE